MTQVDNFLTNYYPKNDIRIMLLDYLKICDFNEELSERLSIYATNTTLNNYISNTTFNLALNNYMTTTEVISYIASFVSNSGSGSGFRIRNSSHC
jgi:hypothetical protein